MDYSGPVVGTAWEGVTWFDHPSNPRVPDALARPRRRLDVRGLLLERRLQAGKRETTGLAYGFHVHAGSAKEDIAEVHRKAFAESPGWEVVKAERPWRVRLERTKK